MRELQILLGALAGATVMVAAVRGLVGLVRGFSEARNADMCAHKDEIL